MAGSKSSAYRKIYSFECICWKRRKIKINLLTFCIRKVEKEEHIKSKVSGRKEVIKFRVEIKEIRNWNQLRNATKAKAGSLNRLMKLISL